jgi:hypothetical protein
MGDWADEIVYGSEDIDSEMACLKYKKIEKETEKAIFVTIRNKKIWLPKSQIKYDQNYLWMPEWLADKHDL